MEKAAQGRHSRIIRNSCVDRKDGRSPQGCIVQGSADLRAHLFEPTTVDAVNFGQFLDIWSVTPDTMALSGSPPISVDKSLLHTILTRKPSVVVVDGHPYSGDIRKIPLKAHTLITLGYGVKSVAQKPYDFSSVDGTTMPSH